MALDAQMAWVQIMAPDFILEKFPMLQIYLGAGTVQKSLLVDRTHTALVRAVLQKILVRPKISEDRNSEIDR